MRLNSYRCIKKSSWHVIIYSTCNKFILENCGTSRFHLDCHEHEKMYNEAVDNYGCALEFIPNCYKSQKICNKAVNTSLFAIQVAPKCYKTQEMCDKAVDTCPFVSDSAPNRYKTQ